MISKKRIITGIGALLLGCIFSMTAFQLSSRKAYWIDESFGTITGCAGSPLAMIKEGAPGQCSPPPLYYILQNFWVGKVTNPLNDIFVQYRAISIASFALLTASLLWFFASYSGWVTAIGVLFALNFQYLFTYFGAEDRPYMLWQFFFVVSILLTTIYATSKPDTLERKSSAFLLVPTFLLFTLTASPGFLQISGLLIVLFYFYLKRSGPKPFLLFSTLLICTGIAFYYNSKGCTDTSNTENFDLIKTGNLSLLWGVLRLLWPEGGILPFISNLFFLFGLSIPFLQSRRQTHRAQIPEPLLFLSYTLWIQILMGIVIGFLIALNHYFFVQRLFLFLIGIHAVGVACGIWYFSLYIKAKKMFSLVFFLLILSTTVFQFTRNIKHVRGQGFDLPEMIIELQNNPRPGAITVFVEKDYFKDGQFNHVRQGLAAIEPLLDKNGPELGLWIEPGGKRGLLMGMDQAKNLGFHPVMHCGRPLSVLR